MANTYYIDKIKYTDTYKLLDSGATHTNGILTGTTGNFETTGTIKAGTGVFNELIAVNLSARNASITELTAQNATVMGIMDVKGKLMTNSWEAASIANVGGNFYISPTGKDTGTPNVTIVCNSVSSGAGTYTITVAKGSSSGQGNGFGVSSTSSSLWSKGSRVLMTGNVKFGTKNYPLGSLDGIVSNDTNGIVSSSNVITNIILTSITSSALDLIFTEQSTLAENQSLSGTSNGSNMQISLYQNKTGSYFYPIGILLSSYGQSDQQQYIDIYGGSIKLGRNANDTTNLSTGMAEPVLRIGQLDGLPNIVDGSTAAETTPEGWGIYTTNGYFKGKIVSNAGKIASWNISDTALYNGNTGINTTTTGAYLGYATDNTGLNISGGTAATTITIANSNFTKSINNTSYNNLRVAIGSNFGMDSSGNIYANGANITNISAGNISTGTLSADRIGATSITAGKLNVSTLSTITADMGTITAGSITKNYNSINFNNSPATLEFKNNSLWSNATQGIKYDSNGLAIKGTIEATSFVAKYNDSSGTIGAQLTATGLEVFDTSGVSVGQFGTTARLGNDSQGFCLKLTERAASNSKIGIYDWGKVAGFIYANADNDVRLLKIEANAISADNDNYSLSLSSSDVFLTYNSSAYLRICSNDNNELWGGLHLNSGNLNVLNSADIRGSLTTGASVITEAHVRPNNNGTSTNNYCGTSDYAWNGVYTRAITLVGATLGTANVTGAITCSSSIQSLGSLVTSGHCRPNNNLSTEGNINYCGNTSYRWNGIYSKAAVDVSSDRKLKNITGSIEFAKELIMNLQPVDFKFIESDQRRKHMGLIAQDVAQTCKEIGEDLSFVAANYITENCEEEVKYYGEDVDDELLTWGIRYEELIAPIIKVVQSQQQEIELLKQRIELLEEGN